MDQIEIFDIPTPCKQLCERDLQGFCVQCNLSLKERAGWGKFTNPQKNNVLRLCRMRAARRRYLWHQQQSAKLAMQSEQLDFEF